MLVTKDKESRIGMMMVILKRQRLLELSAKNYYNLLNSLFVVID